jgi:hypothetical protein
MTFYEHAQACYDSLANIHAIIPKVIQDGIFTLKKEQLNMKEAKKVVVDVAKVTAKLPAVHQAF